MVKTPLFRRVVAWRCEGGCRPERDFSIYSKTLDEVILKLDIIPDVIQNAPVVT
jgi:hypothetical protein